MHTDKIIKNFITTCLLQVWLIVSFATLYQVSRYKYNFIDVWMCYPYINMITFALLWFFSPWLVNAIGGTDVRPIKFIALLIKNEFIILAIIVTVSDLTTQIYKYASMMHTGAYEVAAQYILHDKRTERIVGKIKSVNYKFWSAPQEGRSVYVITDNGEFFITIDMIKDDTGAWRVESVAEFSVNPLFKHTASGQLR